MSRSAAVARLLDDASQFPPGNLALQDAWPAHRGWRQNPIVGRFLMPSGRLAALAELLDGDDGAEVGIVVAPDDGSEVLEPVADAARVTAIELRGEVEDIAAWREDAPQADIFLEGVAVEHLAGMRAIDSRIAAKVRCGGLKRDAFPTLGELASFIQSCVRLDVPFKATAGLHGALRHWDPEIGVHHHGFMNLWTATALAARDANMPELARCLEVKDANGLRRFGVSVDELGEARRWFTAFGTCSIDEPLEGLAAVGMLDG